MTVDLVFSTDHPRAACPAISSPKSPGAGFAEWIGSSFGSWSKGSWLGEESLAPVSAFYPREAPGLPEVIADIRTPGGSLEAKLEKALNAYTASAKHLESKQSLFSRAVCHASAASGLPAEVQEVVTQGFYTDAFLAAFDGQVFPICSQEIAPYHEYRFALEVHGGGKYWARVSVADSVKHSVETLHSSSPGENAAAAVVHFGSAQRGAVLAWRWHYAPHRGPYDLPDWLSKALQAEGHDPLRKLQAELEAVGRWQRLLQVETGRHVHECVEVRDLYLRRLFRQWPYEASADGTVDLKGCAWIKNLNEVIVGKTMLISRVPHDSNHCFELHARITKRQVNEVRENQQLYRLTTAWRWSPPGTLGLQPHTLESPRELARLPDETGDICDELRERALPPPTKSTGEHGLSVLEVDNPKLSVTVLGDGIIGRSLAQGRSLVKENGDVLSDETSSYNFSLPLREVKSEPFENKVSPKGAPIGCLNVMEDPPRLTSAAIADAADVLEDPDVAEDPLSPAGPANPGGNASFGSDTTVWELQRDDTSLPSSGKPWFDAGHELDTAEKTYDALAPTVTVVDLNYDRFHQDGTRASSSSSKVDSSDADDDSLWSDTSSQSDASEHTTYVVGVFCGEIRGPKAAQFSRTEREFVEFGRSRRKEESAEVAQRWPAPCRAPGLPLSEQLHEDDEHFEQSLLDPPLISARLHTGRFPPPRTERVQ